MTVRIERKGRKYDIVDYRTPKNGEFYVTVAHGGEVVGPGLMNTYDYPVWNDYRSAERIIVVPVAKLDK
jgi:hypothetical protein